MGNPTWLDFNMLQTGRNSTHESINLVKKSLDGESLYENLVYGPYDETNNKWKDNIKRTPFQVREDAYSELFIGAFGNTYGHQAIYAFTDVEIVPDQNKSCYKNKKPQICTPSMPWEEALDAPGATQMQHVTALMQSRPIQRRVPAQSLLLAPKDDIYDWTYAKKSLKVGFIVATKGDGYIMVYSSKGRKFTLNIPEAWEEINAWWYNPRTGENSSIAVTKESSIDFTPLKKDEDWVLVVDDTKRNFPAPGSAD